MLKIHKSKASIPFSHKLEPPNAAKSMKIKIALALSALILLALFEQSNRIRKEVRIQTLSAEIQKENAARRTYIKEEPRNTADISRSKKTFESAPKCAPQNHCDKTETTKPAEAAPSPKQDIRFNLPGGSTLPGYADSTAKKARYTERVKTIVIV